MKTDPQLTRIVRLWLREDGHEDAERLLFAVLNQLDTSPQRRAGWLARRFPIMNSNRFRFGMAAAAVILASILGINFLPGNNLGAPPETPTPEPTTTPEASDAQPSNAAGDLEEGPFALYDGSRGGPPITVTIPAPGWYGLPGSGILVKNNNSDAPDGAGIVGPFDTDLYVPGDPCQWEATTPDTPATTVDELVAALEGQPSRDPSAPVDITVDRYAGKSITLHVPDDAAYAGGRFSECDQGEFCTLVMEGVAGCARYHQGPGQIDELWILDVDGEVLVIVAAYYEQTPADHVDEMRAIVESATFEQ